MADLTTSAAPATQSKDHDQPTISIDRISKSFGGVRVLHEVSMDLHRGRVHGLVGMNGSGKSTLIKILAGIHRPDPGGDIRFDRAEAASRTSNGVRAALRLRRFCAGVAIGFVHQDLGLIDSLSVAENFAMSLGFATNRSGWVDQRRVDERTAHTLARVGADVSYASTVGELGAADRTLVAVARALDAVGTDRSACLVLDEPTAALPPHEVDRVLTVIERLAAQGTAILLVTHHLKEILRVCDDITVMRDGYVVHSGELRGIDEQHIIDLMLGDKVEHQLAQEQRVDVPADAVTTTRTGTAVARINHVSGYRPDDVSFDVSRGEIVVLTGLVGCGKSEIGRLVAGAATARTGTVTVAGETASVTRQPTGMRPGVGYVPSERIRKGGILEFTAQENVTLSVLSRLTRWGLIRQGAESATALQMMKTVDVHPYEAGRMFSSFSGGNQQKLVLGRALLRKPHLLIVDEPTQGVDVGAIPTLYRAIRGAAEAGSAVLIITSSYDEAVKLADRVIFLDRGRITGHFTGDDITVSRLTSHGGTACHQPIQDPLNEDQP